MMLGAIGPKDQARAIDVAEVFSPPRVTELATKVGLTPGFALDLRTNDPFDNEPWDLSKPEKRKRAKQLIEQEKPMLLIGSPPCTPFSVLFSSNISRMDPEKVRQLIK